MKAFVLVALLVTLVAFAVISRTGEQADPSFNVDLYQGEEILGTNQINLTALQGKPVILNFWAQSCGPCVAEMPHFEAFHQVFKDDVILIGVDMGAPLYRDTKADSLKFLEERVSITYPVGAPVQGGAVIEKYDIFALPHTVFISSEGEVLKDWRGILTEKKLTEEARTLFELG